MANEEKIIITDLLKMNIEAKVVYCDGEYGKSTVLPNHSEILLVGDITYIDMNGELKKIDHESKSFYFKNNKLILF